jgi:hypothetical protein
MCILYSCKVQIINFYPILLQPKLSNVAVERKALLFHMQNVPGSNLGPETNCRD